MRHTFTFAMLLVLLSTSPLVMGLGLGQATVQSPLNTPLKASIPLIDTSGFDVEQLRVQIADKRDFEAIGLSRTPLAASVRANISREQGEWQVQLSTQRPVNDPWLDLLLYLDSPQGRQMREVTLLLDPPDYASMPSLEEGSPQASPDASVSPSASISPSASASRSTTASVAQPSSSASRAPGRQAAGSAYISRGDTLWSVAERLRPAEASVQQMMIALLEANPEVFPSGNIHEMREGLTLEVPQPSRVTARSPESAAGTIQAMNQAWTRRDGGTPEAVPLPAVQTSEPIQLSETAIAASMALAGVVQSEQVPEAPSREALAEERARLADLEQRWEESQATIQSLLTERESLHEEVDQLHGLLFTLREELDALATAPPKVAQATQDDPWWQAGAALLQRYQWWVAAIAIALLLALLAVLRRRRDTWEEPVVAGPDASRSEPQVSGSGVSSSARSATSSIHARNEAQATPSTIVPASQTEALLHDEAPGMSVADDYAAFDDRDETAPSAHGEAAVEPEPLTETPLQWDDSETPLDRTQAAGLAEQNRRRRYTLQNVDTFAMEADPLSQPKAAPMKALLHEMSMDQMSPVSTAEKPSEPLDERSVTEPSVGSETPEAPAPVNQDRARMVDYEPPVLSSEETVREETPMQPTIDFTSESRSPEAPALNARPPEKTQGQSYAYDTKGFGGQPEVDWEIEEVAFDARDLDNGQPADKPKADSSRHSRDAPPAYRPDAKQ
ncbi:FimV/HubP family polar landmark protein [Vreelandella rituensis]|nr:FimV/HubP family polar landmark protein [Halomonas rituensis]